MKQINERLVVILIFSALLIRELWLLLPYSEVIIHPFRFHLSQGITLQSYVYFACHYCSMLILAYIFSICLSDNYKIIAQAWFYIQAVEFVDYFLTYNTQWFYIGSIGVGITLLKFMVLFGLIIWKFFTVK